MSDALNSMSRINFSADFIIRSKASFDRFLTLLKAGRINAHDRPSRLMRLTLSLISHIQAGSLTVTLSNGTTLRFQGKAAGQHADITFYNDNAVQKFMTGGHVGFCEAYIDGHWSSSNLKQFFLLILENQNVVKSKLFGHPIYRKLSLFLHWMKPNTRAGSRKNILAHYDLGNVFYKAWLDPTMSYSAAIFRHENDTLMQAQIYKYQHIIDRLGAKSGQSILEIGCGWGGFMEEAEKAGYHVTGLTLSPEQAHYTNARMRENGFASRADLVDYRDAHGQYDHIVSIEMFEAVGENYWDIYFTQLKSLLKPGGKAVLQIITINDDDFPFYRKTPDYIQRFVFPGGMLPSPQILDGLFQKYGFDCENKFDFGQDYAKTLDLWQQGFQNSWPHIHEAEPSKDKRFKRMWEQYLEYCSAGFAAGTINVHQYTITH